MIDDSRMTDYEPLLQLGLSEADCRCLVHCGFVGSEYRQRHGQTYGPYYKLRFRSNGRQRVRYLGRDAALAARIRTALATLHNSRRLLRQTLAAMAQLRGRMAALKEDLRPHLAAHGLQLHGYAARQPRTTSADKQNDGDEAIEGDRF